MGNEGLALPHREVLLGKEQGQEAWNDHPVEGGACVTNPVDLRSQYGNRHLEDITEGQAN